MEDLLPDIGEGETEKTFKPEEVITNIKQETVCWKFYHFKEQKNGDGNGLGIPMKEKAYCNICGKGMAYCGTTSSLRSHMKIDDKHLKLWKAAETDQKEKSLGKSLKMNTITNYMSNALNNNNVKKWPKKSSRWQEATRLIAQWLCESSRPTEMLKDPGFVRLINYLAPEYEVPSPTTVTNNILKEYDRVHSEVCKELKDVEYVSLTTDGGTSTNAVSFLDVNAHYVTSDFEMKSVVLAVRENKEKHSAYNYRKKVDEVVEEFGLKEKVVLVTSDNENKMKAAFDNKERNGCLAHSTHNSVTKGVDAVPVVKDILSKCRKVASLHNKSYKFRYDLEEEQKSLNIKQKTLVQDVVTRWGSSRAATASFLTHKDDLAASDDNRFKNFEAINNALLKHQKDKRGLMFSESEMLKVENINKFLTSIDVYSTTLGGNSFVTSSIVLPVIASFKHDMKPSDEDPVYIAKLKENILDDFLIRVSEDVNFEVLEKCTALDVRYKNLKVVEKSRRNKVFETLESEMRVIKMCETSNEDSTATMVSKKQKMDLNFSESEDEDSTEYDHIFDVVRDEMKAYRNEPMIDRDEDLLLWWAKNSLKFPLLSKLARKYLCITATSTEAERTFSSLGLLLTKQRLCMTGQNVNRQLFLKDKYTKKK